MAILIEVPYAKTFRSNRSLQDTFAYLCEHESAITAHFPGLEKLEQIDSDVYRWTFTKLSYGGYDIHVSFATRFSKNVPHLIEIIPHQEGGKTSLKGKWELKGEGKDTLVHFAAELCLELPVPAFLRSMAEPIAKKELSKLFERYTDNVEKALA